MSSSCNLVDCSLAGSSVHVILQTRILEWVAISFFRDLPDAGIEPGSPALQANPLPTELGGKPSKPLTWYTWFGLVSQHQKYLGTNLLPWGQHIQSTDQGQSFELTAGFHWGCALCSYFHPSLWASSHIFFPPLTSLCSLQTITAWRCGLKYICFSIAPL